MQAIPVTLAWMVPSGRPVFDFECSRACDDQGTDKHPPLCVSCVELWYPPGPPPDEDCRSYSV